MLDIFGFIHVIIMTIWLLTVSIVLSIAKERLPFGKINGVISFIGSILLLIIVVRGILGYFG
jgi:hypothetical protein